MSLRNYALTVTRPDMAGTWQKGRYIESTKSTFEITASVQPLSPKEMEMLPEGRRNKESYRIYTDTELNPASQDSKINADIIEINGNNFEVLGCNRWQNGILNHYKILASKI